jgi:uncharacterized protein (TIGR03437 family)
MMKWLLLLLAPPAFAQCTYSISSQLQYNFGAGGGSGTISVNTSAPNCAWSFQTDSPSWITFTSGQPNNSGTGNDAIAFTSAASTQPTGRTAIIQVTGANNFTQNIQVTEAAAICSMTLEPATATGPVGGGSGSFGVQTNCTWTASSNAIWITVPANTTGTGNGQVNYSVAPNTCVDPRSGTITVTGQPNQLFTLNQDGSPGNLTLTPASLTAPAAGTTGRFTLQTGNNCGWVAFSDASWLHILSAASGSGNSGISYSVDANPSFQQRTGSIHLGAALFTVTQQGAPPPSPQLTMVLNGASFQGGAISPGEIVSLFGANLDPVGSPANGMTYQLVNNAVPASLAGVQVMFDSTPAPLLYVSGNQINAIAPYSLAGKTTSQVTVKYQGMTSGAVPVQIQDASPGIFSQDGSGTGMGAILNQDLSVNARLNPAARGSVIAIYVTGVGVLNPASADGSITGLTPPYPAVAQAVTVTIGGVTVPADQISYSGAAPGAVAGLTQINATVPHSVTPGLTVPVVVQIGQWQSQAGITLAVK